MVSEADGKVLTGSITGVELVLADETSCIGNAVSCIGLLINAFETACLSGQR